MVLNTTKNVQTAEEGNWFRRMRIVNNKTTYMINQNSLKRKLACNNIATN